MSLEQIRALRQRGRRPAMVTVIVGKPPAWFEDDLATVVVRNPSRTDFGPLVSLPVHVIDLQDDPAITRATMDALQAVSAKGLGVCGPAGACGVSPEHERAMQRLREGLCATR